MTLKFSPRGATKHAHHLLTPELQHYLFNLVDTQASQNLIMDHWQFFQLRQTNADQIQIIHSQCNPKRCETHFLEGITLPLNELEAWIIDYEELGSTLMIANEYTLI